MKKIFFAALLGLSTATLFGCASKSADVVKLDAGTYQATQGKVTTSLKLSGNGEFNELVVTPTEKQQQYYHGTYRLNKAKNKVFFSIDQLTTVSFGTKSQTTKNQAPITVENASSAKRIPAIRMTAKGKLRLGSASLQPKKLELASQSNYIKHEQKLYQQTYGSLETYAYDSSQKPNADGSHGILTFKGNRFFWDISTKDDKNENKAFVTGDYVFEEGSQELVLKPTNCSPLYRDVKSVSDTLHTFWGTDDSPVRAHNITVGIESHDKKYELYSSDPDFGTYLQVAKKTATLQTVNTITADFEDLSKVSQDELRSSAGITAFKWAAWMDFEKRVSNDSSDYLIERSYTSINNNDSLQVWRMFKKEDMTTPTKGTFYVFDLDSGDVYLAGDWDQHYYTKADGTTEPVPDDPVANILK